MDADIAGAASALDLDKILTQEYRNNATAAQQRSDFILAEGEKLLDPDAELRLKIVKAIGANYMKPTTGTLPETIANDAKTDAARLRAAVDECMKIVKGVA